MTRAALSALLLTTTAAFAHADPAPKLATIATDPADVRAAILVGPAGQIYGPVPDGGGWTRTAAGGVAAGVVAVARHGDELLAASAAAPLYRWSAATWTATPLPVHGAIILGGGPAVSAAVGTAILVRHDKGWAKVAAAPSVPTAVWAAGDTQIWIIADGAAWRLRGKQFVRGAAATALTGAPTARAPLALGPGQALDLASNRAIKATTAGDVIAAATAGPDTWLLVRDSRAASAGAAAIRVERHGRRTAEVATAPAAPWAWIWTDRHGAVAIASPAGDVAIFDGKTWRTAPIADALPAPRAGPGPARTQ